MMLTDEDFFALKRRYYAQGCRPELPVNAPPLRGRHRGATNNREQNALRWGYNAAIRDLQASLGKFVEHMIQGPMLEGAEPIGFLHERET